MQLQRYKERRNGSYLRNKAVNITEHKKSKKTVDKVQMKQTEAKANNSKLKYLEIESTNRPQTIWQAGGEPHGKKTDQAQEVS